MAGSLPCSIVPAEHLISSTAALVLLQPTTFLLLQENALLLNKNENITLTYNASIARWIVANTVGGNTCKLKGNAGIDSATDFLGTVDNNPIVLKINNNYAGSIGSDGLIAMQPAMYLKVRECIMANHLIIISEIHLEQQLSSLDKLHFNAVDFS